MEKYYVLQEKSYYHVTYFRTLKTYLYKRIRELLPLLCSCVRVPIIPLLIIQYNNNNPFSVPLVTVGSFALFFYETSISALSLLQVKATGTSRTT